MKELPCHLRQLCRITLAGILAVSLCITESEAQRTKTSQRAGEQVKAEKGLKDNRYFFYFINSSVTNFGTEEEKGLFREAIQRDILAQLLYMRFQFRESFIEVRKAQKLLIDLYGITLRRDITMTKRLLDDFAPAVIDSKDRRARGYLHLGYRDVKGAQINLGMGDNFRESLYSMRLLQYVKAIKLAKSGKRFAFLSRIEVSSLSVGARREKRLTEGEIEKEIEKFAGPELKEYYRRVHMDSRYLTGDQKSLYDAIWENPAVQDLEDYKRYLTEKDIDM